jgi:hypothetical protein
MGIGVEVDRQEQQKHPMRNPAPACNSAKGK